MTNNNLKLLQLGGMLFYNSDIPVLEVLVDGKIYGYLSTFGGQNFHISRTCDGEFGLAESSDICMTGILYRDLKNFKELAMNAICKCAGYYRKYISDSDIAILYPTEESNFNRFIAESVIYVKERA